MKTGMIGLGAMGAGMALNLHKANQLAAFWNRSPARSHPIEEATEMTAAASPAEVAEIADLIITCVSRDADVIGVINAMLPSIKPGTIVIDTSTVSAETAKTVDSMLQKVGAEFMDSPVSGGVEGAKNGTMAMMLGGDASTLEKIRPTLEVIGGKIIHMGPVGSGQATKAVNQIMCAGIAQGVTDALAFGKAMELDMDKVIDVVASGAAGNWFLDHRGKTMINDEYDVGFKLALHHKDLSICQAMAEQKNTHLRSIDETLEDYETLMEQGHGDNDISALYRLKSKLF